MMVPAWAEACRIKYYNFELFHHFYDFVVVCIGWNYEGVFNIIMHGANMKTYKYNFNISAFVGFIYKIVC